MEVYVAVSDFTSPNCEGSQNILSFRRGDKFEIFDCHKSSSEWWGARALGDNSVGYVPSKYMKFEDRKIGSVLPEANKSTKEDTMKRFSEMQSHENHRSPDEMYPDVPEPEPDYNDDDDSFDSGNPNSNHTNSTTYITKNSDSHDSSASDSGDISNVRKISLSNSVNEAVIFRERKASNPELEKRLSDPGNDDLLIRPKKLVNPCIESRERMALHKELLHNYKVGKNILEKPELQKVLEKRKEKQRVDEWESQKKASTKRTSLEMKLEQQRQKEHQGDMKPIEEKEEKSQSELSKMQAKILSKNSTNAVK